MMGPQHAMSGVAVWWTGCVALDAAGCSPRPVVVFGGALVAGLSAIAPDIDHPRAMVSRILGPVTGLVSWVVSRICGHRGATHYAVTAVVVGVLAGAFAAAADPALWWAGVAVGAGWLTHLLGDACTDAGVPLWGPWCKRRVGLWVPLRFKTGDNGFRVELWLVRPVLAVWLLADMVALAL